MPDTGLPNKTQKGIQSLGIRWHLPTGFIALWK